MDKFVIRKRTATSGRSEVEDISSEEEENATPRRINKKYDQKYKKDWELTKVWLTQVNGRAYCKLCNKSLYNNIFNLDRHANSNNHTKTETNLSENPCTQISLLDCLQKLPAAEVDKIRKELKLVTYCVQHSLPFSIMDSMPQLLNEFAPIDKRVKCGSTKTTEIVNTILGPYALNLIVEELRLSHFSLIIDEGTDLSMTKCLTIIVRFVPEGETSVADRFFGLIEPEDGTANSLYESLTNYVKSFDIPLQNAIGLSTDNASVMQGKNQSVRQKFKENNKNMFYLGCTCHSLNLCSSYASRCLPPQLEKLVKDIYCFFSTSAKRQKGFREFQEHFGTLPHKILGLSATRWLSLEAVVDRVLEQWQPLQHFFLLFSFEELRESSATSILEQLNSTNKAYFLFLRYILKKINIVNKKHQAEGTLIHLLYAQMETFFKDILQNFVKRDQISFTTDYKNKDLHLVESEMFFGLDCTDVLETGEIDSDLIRKDLINYYITLCNQIKKRFDFSDNKIKLLEYFDPKIIQKGKMPTITQLLEAFPFHKSTPEVMNNEWRNLIVYDNIKINKIFEQDILKGWINLSKEKNILDEFLFKNLCEYMCSLAVLPHSSASAERSFSVMNTLKTAKRNRLTTKSVSNQMFVKEMCENVEIFEPSNNLIRFYKKFKFVDGKFIVI